MKIKHMKWLALSSAMGGVIAIVACSGGSSNPQSLCDSMNNVAIGAAQFSYPTTGANITSTTYVTSTTTGNTNGNYCKILGSIHPIDKTAPDINFQLNVPNTWNGKVVQSGGGGYDGNIPNTLGATTLGLTTIPTPLAAGYMTLADDSGHQAADSNDASFAMNDEAMVNFGYMHIKKAHDVAVAIAQIMNGKAPKRFYYQGGSTGGREALTAAMRWPESYDGVLVNYPTANFLGIRLWGVALGRAIYDNNSAGWIPPALVDKIASNAIAKCDALDGVVDGLVSNMAACRAQSDAMIASMMCQNGETGNPTNCITPVQLAKTLNVYHNGFTIPYSFANNVNGYDGYNSNEGITMGIGTSPNYVGVDLVNAHHVFRADQFFKYFVAKDPNFNILNLDIQNPGVWQNKIVSLSDILGATTPDWSTFANKGGKVLWLQGNDDPSVSPYSNIKVFNTIVAKMGASSVANFMKLYLVPGLAHGGGNFSPVWDNLNALDTWVENGTPPAAPVVFDGTSTATKGRSRPLCEYPTWPKYNGAGDINLAASYSCSK